METLGGATPRRGGGGGGGGGSGEEKPNLWKKRRLRLGVGGGSVVFWGPGCEPELDGPLALAPGAALWRFGAEAE